MLWLLSWHGAAGEDVLSDGLSKESRRRAQSCCGECCVWDGWLGTRWIRRQARRMGRWRRLARKRRRAVPLLGDLQHHAPLKTMPTTARLTFQEAGRDDEMHPKLQHLEKEHHQQTHCNIEPSADELPRSLFDTQEVQIKRASSFSMTGMNTTILHLQRGASMDMQLQLQQRPSQNR